MSIHSRGSLHSVVCVLSLAGVLLLTGCEIPSTQQDQVGYRGTGMVQVTNPRLAPKVDAIPVALPRGPSAGPKAGEIYQNVQVLGDLSIGDFTRLMAAMTSWVAPEQGCNHCHNPADLASDDIYTKVVSRRMLQMTRNINENHQAHVGETGVTCYTCHRGMNVPEQIWTDDPGPPSVAGMAGWRDSQNSADQSAAVYSSLPFRPFQRYLTSVESAHEGIRVNSSTALPLKEGGNSSNIKDAEWTYALMMHISDGLGVNCTYCHNTRAFGSWEQSNPARTTAWYGLSMVANLNESFLAPLAAVLPGNRLGVLGDAPKANCATCHQGLAKPLNGAPMLKDYPSLAGGQ